MSDLFSNPKFVTLRAKFEERGVLMRLMWSAKRNREARYDDVGFFIFYGETRCRIGTAIVIDYGDENGIGFYPESLTNNYDDDVAFVIAEPRVLIEISGGVAGIIHCPVGVRVAIIDRDNEEAEREAAVISNAPIVGT